MSHLIALQGVDGLARAIQIDQIRLLADNRPESDPITEEIADPKATVTLVDGTQFDVVGDVAAILQLIEKLES